MNTKQSLRNDSDGHIVVETVGAFIPFVLLVISILSLVNIVTVQARVHYALTQAANTISIYSYTLEILGISDKLIGVHTEAARVRGEVNALKSDINSVISGIEAFSDISGAAESSGRVINRVYGWGETAAGDPMKALELLIKYGESELFNQLFDELARPLVGRYLANGDLTGDEFLTWAGVVNTHTGTTGIDALEFCDHRNPAVGSSVLLDANGDVRLVVEYEISYTFGLLPLPFNPTLKITQSAVTKAWLGGSGKGYW